MPNGSLTFFKVFTLERHWFWLRESTARFRLVRRLSETSLGTGRSVCAGLGGAGPHAGPSAPATGWRGGCLHESEVGLRGFQAAQSAMCVCLITLWLVCSRCFCQLVFKKKKWRQANKNGLLNVYHFPWEKVVFPRRFIFFSDWVFLF